MSFGVAKGASCSKETEKEEENQKANVCIRDTSTAAQHRQ
jgi:hypothetical protein